MSFPEFSYPGQPYEYDDPKPANHRQAMYNRQPNPHAALDQLRAEVELLRRANPEMDEDEKLFADMVEGATNVPEFIHACLRQYFDKHAIAAALRERADRIERSQNVWKEYIRKARAAGHITEKQVFPEGTIFESKRPDELIYIPEQIPDEYKKVDTVKLRAAVKKGLIDEARLVPSNEPKLLNIRIK